MILKESASDTTLAEIESEILSAKSLLKLRGIPQGYYTKRRSLELIIDDILWKNENFSTLYVSNNAEQCTSGKRRSQGDLFKIVKYYRPEVTFKDFRKALLNLVNEKKVATLFCTDIHKRVFVKRDRVYQAYRPVYYNETTEDELGLTLIPIPPNTPSYIAWNGRVTYSC